MELPARVRDAVAGHAAVQLLVLLGSRARGDHRASSDWDFGVLGDDDLDLGALVGDLVGVLGTEAVDVADLRAASAVLRRDAAAVGVPVVEREDGAFEDFQVEVSLFWCDVEPVLREAHAAVLRAAG